MFHKYKSYIRFILLALVTIFVTYFLPVILSQIWYVFLLILYWNSNDEPFWLAFFLITVDGFLWYFGIYTVVIRLIPGQPPIELAQFYILLSVIKAGMRKRQPSVFYKDFLWILFIYLLFMIAWGQIMGFSGEIRDYFRIAKLTLPFFMFYSLPRLLTNVESYKRLFAFIFIILVAGFATQLFSLLTGFSPGQGFELTEEQISEAGAYRGFYNIAATLLGLFGALFFLASRERNSFNRIYLYGIITSAYGMAYLSATRGWILSFTIVIFLAIGLTSGISIKKIAGFTIFVIIVITIALSNQKIREQVGFASSRFKTLEAVTGGDVTAEGTLSRLDVRGPRVMKIFSENPLFGWGFSDTARKYTDSHVGNQSILLYSGIIGFTLLIGFMFYFSIKLLLLYFKKGKQFVFKSGLPVFIIFLSGWFIIHSTSGQHFNYMGIPGQIMPQAIFFSFGALVYAKSKSTIDEP
jgi:hypothetical protein